jgi:hypothetical protein
LNEILPNITLTLPYTLHFNCQIDTLYVGELGLKSVSVDDGKLLLVFKELSLHPSIKGLERFAVNNGIVYGDYKEFMAHLAPLFTSLKHKVLFVLGNLSRHWREAKTANYPGVVTLVESSRQLDEESEDDDRSSLEEAEDSNEINEGEREDDERSSLEEAVDSDEINEEDARFDNTSSDTTEGKHVQGEEIVGGAHMDEDVAMNGIDNAGATRKLQMGLIWILRGGIAPEYYNR